MQFLIQLLLCQRRISTVFHITKSEALFCASKRSVPEPQLRESKYVPFRLVVNCVYGC